MSAARSMVNFISLSGLRRRSKSELPPAARLR
jgi:hypothetical protein